MRSFVARRCSMLTFVLIAALAPAAAIAQPNVSAEETLRQLVRAMNAGDAATLERFVDARFLNTGPNSVPIPTRVANLGRMQARFGQLTIHSVEPAKESEISALVQAGRTEAWRRLTLTFAGEPPRISRVGLFVIPSPPDKPAKQLSDSELAQELEAYMKRIAARDVFSGAVLLARNGKPLYRAAFGEANKDFAVKNTPETKFNLGSMNKMFTAVAVMQLVEAGKVSLEDTLGKFLKPGAMGADVLSKVRIKHLLTHTAGLGSYFNEEWDRTSRARFRSVDDWMALVKNETLAFEPGTRWAYSNTGMLVLGKVIEVASGMDYFDYVRERIAKPAGMINTDAYELDRVNRNLAVGYEAEQGPNGVEWRNNVFMHVIRGGPAGGGYSTVDDLTRFAEALKAGKLVSAASYKLLTTPKPELASPAYGFGFAIGPEGRTVGHAGGFPGINSQLDIYPGEEYTLVVMSNYGFGAEPVIEKFRGLFLAGRPVKTTTAR
jgi:CubicO group peptidase (beta-lactamase class C family)